MTARGRNEGLKWLLARASMDRRMCEEAGFEYFNSEEFKEWNETQGIKDWQNELFDLKDTDTLKLLEKEYNSNPTLKGDYFNYLLLKIRDWLSEVEKDGIPHFDTIVVENNREEVNLFDQAMLHSDKNPLLTNMDVAVHVPQRSHRCKFDELETNLGLGSETGKK